MGYNERGIPQGTGGYRLDEHVLAEVVVPRELGHDAHGAPRLVRRTNEAVEYVERLEGEQTLGAESEHLRVGCSVSGAGFIFRGAGFSVQGLGFGVWGLGCGVWGLGLRG